MRDEVDDDTPVEDNARDESRRGPRISLACVAVAIVVGFGAFRLVEHIGKQFTSVGDVAFIELGVRQALYHGNALGVYSRFGWHHPGPALFYLLAPVYWLGGETSRSLFLGAWLVNGGCALGAVVLVRIRAGELAARLTAIAIFWLLIVGGFSHVINPWNPRMLALPLLLLIAAVAGAYSGSAWSFVVALATASYLVQAHVGTLPVSVALLVLATIGFWRTRTPERTLRSLRAPLVVAVGLLALMWIGPFVQEVTNGNGNLSQIVSFYVHPHTSGPTSHSLHSSLVVVSNRSTVVPIGNPHGTRGHGNRLLATGALAALGIAAFVIARRRAPFIAALGLTTTIGFVAAVLAASRVVGPQDAYLFYWTEVLPLPALIAGAWLAIDQLPRLASERIVSILTATALVVFFAWSWDTVANAHTTSFGDTPAARTIADGIARELGTTHKPFNLHVDASRLDPGALSVELDRRGYHFHLDATVDLYSGNISAPSGGPTFFVRAAGTPPPVGPAERDLLTDGKVELSVSS